jgi:peptidoglycan/xylan/chitin deacetylase (PgdA/CDA1 family)
MNSFRLKLWIVSTFLIIMLGGCQSIGNGIMSQPTVTNTPISSSTSIPTNTAIPTETSTPTVEPTATTTPTPTPAFITIEPGVVKVPILLYHHVNPDIKNSRYNIDPVVFEEQVKWLHDNGYSTINVTTLANLIRDGGQIPLRPVIITFDDGNLDIFQNAYPILKKYGFAATFYVVDQYIAGQDMISSEQLIELTKNGWEIGSHSEHHTNLTAENADLETEIRLSKVNMERKLGITINSFAYPYGQVNEKVVDKTYRSGYTSAVGLGESNDHGRDTLYYLLRIEIENDFSMDNFISLLPWSGPIK